MRINECPEIETYIVESNEKAGGNRGTRRSVRCTGHRECRVCGYREANPPVAHSSDGGGMKRLHLAFQPSLAGLIVFGIAGALWLSRSVAAAEPPAEKKVAAADASGDGALFAAFVPGSAPPSLHELPFSGRLSPAGR